MKLDFNSLRLRLTAGVAAFSILGLGSLATWDWLENAANIN